MTAALVLPERPRQVVEAEQAQLAWPHYQGLVVQAATERHRAFQVRATHTQVVLAVERMQHPVLEALAVVDTVKSKGNQIKQQERQTRVAVVAEATTVQERQEVQE